MQGRRAGRRWAQQGPLTTSAEQAPQVANRGRSPPLPGRSALLLSYWGARACGELGGYRASPQWGAITTTAGLLLRAPLLRNGTSILQAAQDETPLLDPSIQSISKSCLSTNPVNCLKTSQFQRLWLLHHHPPQSSHLRDLRMCLKQMRVWPVCRLQPGTWSQG